MDEEEIVELVLRHVGRHIASSHGADGGEDVARLVNGLAVGRRYTAADRLIALTTAASAAAGGAAERLEVVPLPLPVNWEKIDVWVRMFSRDGQAGRIERCLLTARVLGEEDRVLPLLFECAVEPHFIGFSDNIISLVYLSETVDVFGWDGAAELVFNLGAKLVGRGRGRGRGEPERFRRDAVRLMRQMAAEIDQAAQRQRSGDDYDEDAFVEALVSPDIEHSFAAVKTVLDSDVKLERVITSLVMLAADRMARTPVNVNAGWRELTAELNLATALRTVLRLGGPRAAARGLFHFAWLIFVNRWLNIPSQPLSQVLDGGGLDVGDEDEGMERIVHSIKTLNVQEVGGQVQGYFAAGYSGEKLLEAIGRTILWDDTGPRLLPALRTMFEEWSLCQGHAARNDLDTYPVQVEDSGIFIDVSGDSGKRSDAHFLLLKEGLMSGDNWTLSKAIAILLARGVSEEETLALLVRHMGRHMATELDGREGRPPIGAHGQRRQGGAALRAR